MAIAEGELADRGKTLGQRDRLKTSAVVEGIFFDGGQSCRKGERVEVIAFLLSTTVTAGS